MEERAEREGDAEALADAQDGLGRIEAVIATLEPLGVSGAAINAMRGPGDDAETVAP